MSENEKRNKIIKSHKGFTLFEVVVVVAFIGTLLMLATPRYLNRIEKSKAAEVSDSIEAIEYNYSMYVTNNRNALPEGAFYVSIDDILTYVEDGSVFNGDGLIEGLDPNKEYIDISETNVIKKSNVNLDGLFIVDDRGKMHYINTDDDIPEYLDRVNIACFESIEDEFGLLITGYKDVDADGNLCTRNVKIPSEINNVPVTGIAEEAFRESDTQISSIASRPLFLSEFQLNDNPIESIKFPDTLQYIGSAAFEGNELKEVVLPDSVTTIGERNPFANNPLLVGIVVDHNNSNFMNYENGLYTKDGKRLIAGTKESANNMLDGLEIVGHSAFKGMSVYSISFPNTVRAIEDNSFYYNLLERVRIPYTLVNMGSNVFAQNGINKNSYDFPESDRLDGEWILRDRHWVSIGSFIYTQVGENIVITDYSSYGPEDLYIPSEIDGLSVLLIDDWLLANMTLTSVVFEDGITSIPKHGFRNNYITSVTLPESMENIGVNAFKGNGPNQDSPALKINGSPAGTWIYDGRVWIKQ